MKLACFESGGAVRVGIVDEAAQSVRPLDASIRDIVDIVERYDELKGSLKGGDALPLASVKLRAPIPAPRRNVICVGKNYREHAREFAKSGFEAGAVKGAEIDEHPAVFTKPASSVIGPGDTVDLHPEATQMVDYEAELAVVIGRAGKNIPKERAYDHVFGYTIINDVPARDRQRSHKQWFLGKALDTFCPMGPWIATADEVEPENLDVKCWVNGELRQNANTRDLIFDIPTLIAYTSNVLTLEPGDLILTGTPEGVGYFRDPKVALKPGDVVEVEVEGVGTLRNDVR